MRLRRRLELEGLEARTLLSASDVTALFRSGQTFLTWAEDTAVTGESYHVYRSGQPITSANLAEATRLTERWGALPEGTSAYTNERDRDQPVQQNFIITDLGPELADTTGLFVHTAATAGSAYYAVTQVVGGVEDTTIVPGVNATTTAVAESVQTPQPVLVQQTQSGRGLVFTQFMDYASWNPTLDGYAYNYSVALPPGYDGSEAVPLMLYFQGWGGRYEVHDGNPYDWNSIWVEVDDPRQTWYYGFAAEHDFRDGGLPTTGPIVNFTEMRILQAVDEVSARFNVDEQRIWGHGNSMGGSGMVALALRYPSVFSAVYAGLPMTNYQASGDDGGTDWVPDQDFKWGAVASNLPIENRGPHAADLAQYDGTGVWDWQNHQAQVQARAGDDMAFLAFAHRMQDSVIDWEPEGQPWVGALYAARVGFSGAATPGGHTWPGFIGASAAMIGGGSIGFDDFQFRRDLSFPAFSDVSGAPPVPPPTSATETYRYNTDLEWSTPWNDFGPQIVDQAERYEITLRSTSQNQTADVTPRRLQQFVVTAGQSYDWTVLRLSDGTQLGSGSVVADSLGRITVPDVAITTAGTRLLIEPSALPPNQSPFAGFSANPASGPAPLTVALDASSSFDPDGTIVSYAWAFGDGTTATGVTVSKTFTTAGSYTAALTVTDDRGASTTFQLTLTVLPNQPPVAAYTVSPISGSAPLTVNFDASGSSDPNGTIADYTWDFGDGTSATGVTVSKTYATAGSYTATLTVTDDQGATATAQLTLTVLPNQPPIAAFTVSPLSGDAPLTVNFDASGSSDPNGTIAGYAWDFGDGTTGTGVTVSKTYDTAGSYAATLTVTDDSGGTATAGLTITVSEPPPNPDRDFVQTLYSTFLGRPAQAGEITAWTSVLTSVSRSAAAELIIRSTEGLTRVVNGFYTDILGRVPDAAGAAFWAEQLAAGLSIQDVLAVFLGSDEFATRADTLIGTNDSDVNYVRALYQVLLGRGNASQDDITFWQGVLPIVSRTDVARFFLGTTEFRSAAVRTLYGEPVLPFLPQVLQRTTTTSDEVGFWAGSQLDLLTIAVVFAATGEFSPQE